MTIHSTQFLLPSIPASWEDPVDSLGSGTYAKRGKRAFDLALVLAAAPVWVTVVGILALVVWLTGGRPIYSQRRIGRHGRIFTMWKLRSMVPDAETALADHLAANPFAQAEWDRTQKLQHDPRVTRFGRFLRRTSLDELPQLWNVLKGDMSLVGPRPMTPEQKPLYPGRAYYALRPGITGLWQISGRSRSSFAARSKFDHCYARGLSFGKDVKILLATTAVVLRCTGV